jgi:hypothetical protein
MVEYFRGIPPTDFEWIAIAVLAITIYVEFSDKRKIPRLMRAAFFIPGKVIRINLFIITLGVLVGCANSDPLPVAKGPLFQLNAGVWHASSPDLSDPPHVAED